MNRILKKSVFASLLIAGLVCQEAQAYIIYNRTGYDMTVQEDNAFQSTAVIPNGQFYECPGSDPTCVNQQTGEISPSINVRDVDNSLLAQKGSNSWPPIHYPTHFGINCNPVPISAHGTANVILTADGHFQCVITS